MFAESHYAILQHYYLFVEEYLQLVEIYSKVQLEMLAIFELLVGPSDQ